MLSKMVFLWIVAIQAAEVHHQVFFKTHSLFVLSICTGMELGTKNTTLKKLTNIWLNGLIIPTNAQFTGHNNKHHLLFANWQQPTNLFLTYKTWNLKGRTKGSALQWIFKCIKCIISYWDAWIHISWKISLCQMLYLQS